MVLVQKEPKKICMWGEPPAPIIEYDQGEGTIVVQRRDIFTGTITESGTYTFQASLKSTSNWTSHLILYVNGNETVHFMKAGADGFLGFSKDVDLSSGDSVRIYGYHDLSGEVAYVAGTKLFKAELEPISSSISGTVSTGSSLYAVYNLSNPTPGVYRWNVGSRSNSNGINLYKSINGGAGELIASMTDGSYVDVQVSEGTTSLSLFYSMGSGSSTNISGGSVTVYPDSSSLIEREIKKITIRPNGVEKQIRPDTGWQPGVNTRLYLPLNSTDNFTDKSGNSYTVTNAGNAQFGTYGGVDCVYFTGSANSYATLNNFAFNSDTNWTISFWEYYIDGQYPTTFASTSNVGFGKSFKLGPITNEQFGYEVFGRNGDGGGTESSMVVDNTMSYKNVWCHYCLVMDGVEGDVAHFKAYINNTQVSHYDGGKWFYTSTRPNYCFGSDPYYGIDRRLGRFYLSNFIIENKSWTAQERQNYYNQTKGNYGL